MPEATQVPGSRFQDVFGARRVSSVVVDEPDDGDTVTFHDLREGIAFVQVSLEGDADADASVSAVVNGRVVTLNVGDDTVIDKVRVTAYGLAAPKR